ncbi:MAG: sugar ABC transporter substrate-binding protein, partial [Clostridia bacterium]|nr:sugar ABC transporter substrate-binding protein [Clostridia bacterium]
KNSGNNIDYTMTLNGIYLGDATEMLSYPGIPADEVALAKEYGMNNGRFAKHYSVGTIEAENEVGSSLTTKRDELLTKAVTASVEDFDAVWDEHYADYMSIGGEAIVDERIEKLEAFYGIKYEK